MKERICKYNCYECRLHETIEEKQICAPFMAVMMMGKAFEEISVLKSMSAKPVQNEIDITPVMINDFTEENGGEDDK